MESNATPNRSSLLIGDIMNYRRKSILTTNGTIEDNEEIRNCLKAFFDNKINKKNAWSMNLIDNFSNLVNGHHKKLKNFQIVGNTLEASSKIYGLRVDTVYTDAVRLASGIGARKFTDDDDDDNNNDDFDDQTNVQESESADNKNGATEQNSPKKKRKRARKAVSTVTRNKDTLNAKLETNVPADPLFARWNSMPGDITSPNRMFSAILDTVCSNLSLSTVDQFFDCSECEPVVFNEAEDNLDDDVVRLPLKIKNNRNLVLRPNLSGYQITNRLSDDDDDDQTDSHNAYDEIQDIDMVFDINAEVEPINENDYQILDVDYGGAGVMEEEEENAIKACSALRFSQHRLSDLRPVENVDRLEYSYRPMDGIGQFWAGPSHWKFRKNTNFRRRLSQVRDKPVVTQKKKTKSTKDLPSDFFSFNENEDADFIAMKSVQAKKIKKLACYNEPSPYQFKLPNDLKINSSIFENYVPAVVDKPAVQARKSVAVMHEVASNEPEVNEEQVYDRDQLRSLCDDMFVDEGMDYYNDAAEENNESQNLDEIGMKFEGAPEMIPTVNINFAKRAKMIDMKQLKRCSLRILRSDVSKTQPPRMNETPKYDEQYSPGAVTFDNIYNNLPKLLTPDMSENLSTSVAFYTILHLCNENQLRLFKYYQNCDDTNKKSASFFVREIKTSEGKINAI